MKTVVGSFGERGAPGPFCFLARAAVPCESRVFPRQPPGACTPRRGPGMRLADTAAIRLLPCAAIAAYRVATVFAAVY